jgi:hypothetical protein
MIESIVTGTTACVPNHVGITFGQPGEFGRIQPSVHAGEDRESSRRRNAQGTLIAKAGGIRSVGFQHFVQDLRHAVIIILLIS